MTTVAQEMEILEFAQYAARKFKANPDFATCSRKGIEPGALLALRWGMGEDCVFVVRLAEDFEPVNFQQLIKTVEPLNKEPT
jgi:hypothetical protein